MPEEEQKIKELEKKVQAFLQEYKSAATKPDPTTIERQLLHLAMYRPLSHYPGFEVIADWDISQFSEDLQEVLRVQVLEPIEQNKLSDKAVVVSPISSQNEQVAQFYTTRILPP